MPPSVRLAIVRRHWPLLIPIIFALSVFHAWIEPGLLLGADWVRRVPGEMNGYFPWPHVWNSAQQIGENDDSLLSYFPLFSAIGLFSRLHVGWNAIERIFFFFPYLLLSIGSPYVFTLRLTRSPLASAFAATMWTVNTWIIMATERGAIPSIVAASVLPLFFWFAIRFIERATLRRGLGLGLLLTAVLLYDLRYVYIGIVFAAILGAEQLVRDRSLRRLRAAALPLGVAVATAIVTNLYWILPQFVELSSPGAGYASLPDYLLNSGYMTPEHALSGFAVFYHWVASDNPFAVANPEWYFFLVPAAVFASLASVWKRKWVWSLAFGAAISILLNSGPTFPVDKINIWIFMHVPGMTLFRDVTKWMSLLFVTYGAIIALGIARLLAFARLRVRKTAFSRAAPAAIALAAAACYVAIMNDAYNPERYRVFTAYNMHPDVLELERYLQSRPGHLRALIFPRDIEPMRAVFGHPYVEGLQLENSASPDGLRHLDLEWDSLYGMFSSPFAPTLLRELNIGYFVVPYDYDKIVYSSYISNWTFYDALQFARTRPWLRFDRRIGRQYVFRVVDPMRSSAFIAPVPFVMNGDGPALVSLLGTPLLTTQTAALLPDQPLGPIWNRVHNYVGSDWTVDTNLNGTGPARSIVRAGEAQAKAAAQGRYAFVAAATSTASRKKNLYSGDDPLVMRTIFRLPRRGPVSFAANLSDLRPLSQTLYRSRTFGRTPKTIEYDPTDVIFEFKPDPNDKLLDLEYSRSAHAYIASMQFDNENPITLTADVSFASIHALVPFTVSFDGRNTNCPQVCKISKVVLAPGRQHFTLTIPAAPKHPPAIVLSDALALTDPIVPDEPRTATGITLLRNLNLPLDARPYMEFHYVGLSDPLTLFMRVRSRLTGKEAWFADAVPGGNIDIRQLNFAAGDGVHERFLRLLAAHAGDRRWLFDNRLSKEPDGAGEYVVTQIVLTGARATSFRPKSIAFIATPSWPALASNDARQEADVAYPSAMTLVSEHGVRATPVDPLAGYLGYDLRATSPQLGQTVTFSLAIPPSATRYVRFDLLQPAGYSMQFALTAAGQTLVANQLAIDEGTAFDGGGIHVGEPNAVSWPLGEPHCLPDPCGAGAIPLKSNGTWKTFSADLSSFENDWRHEHTVTITLQRVAPGEGDLERFIVSTRAGENGRAGLVPGVLVDNHALNYDRVASNSEIAYRTYFGAFSLPAHLPHVVQSVPLYPYRPVSLLISQGRMQRFTPAFIRDDDRINDEEYEGTIDSHGGMFVFDESYDNDWTLAVVPATFRPSGFALYDWMRTRALELPRRDHYKVTDLLNGWWVPSGSLHVFVLMKLEAIIQLAALLWVLASTVWIVAMLAVTRRRTA